MDCDISSIFESTRQWAVSARQSGWLSAGQLVELDAVDLRSPATLFDNSENRPLVVAFFGGTGVGKSTLLNRLAEAEIANTGVERPTSREVSIYLHNSIRLEQLPANFPVDKVRTAKHENSAIKDILWVDMPDIDSTESNNRQIVLDWLPHIDILLYVVSPERYQDEKGWRLLLSQAANHAWMFIMNQWDKGDASQIEAFRNQLSKGGFENPIILRTDCRKHVSVNEQDDFAQLRDTIASLANLNTIDQLEQRGMMLRFQQLRNTIQASIEAMGPDESVATLREQWEHVWKESADNLQQGMQWPIKQLAQTYSTRTGSLLKQLKKSSQPNKAEEKTPKLSSALLWDNWAQTRFNDALDQLTLEAGASNMPVAPFKTNLENLRNIAHKILHTQTELSLRQALANPGNILQRFFLKLTGICTTVLPLLAINWAAFEIYQGYYQSSTGLGEEYLGSNFAIHSGLLVCISWLLPWFLHRRLKPSAETVALKALTRGVTAGLELTKLEIDETLQKTLEQRDHYRMAGQQLLEQCQHPVFTRNISESQTLNRMLAKKE